MVKVLIQIASPFYSAEIGDLVILEAFDAALLRELCPGAVQAEKEWSEHLQVFKVDHLDCEWALFLLSHSDN